MPAAPAQANVILEAREVGRERIVEMDTTYARRPTFPAALVALVLGLLIVGLSGCGGQAVIPQGYEPQKAEDKAAATEASPYTGNFVGKVPGTDAFVAVVVDRESHVLAYACDGRDGAVELAEWFTGAVADDGREECASWQMLRKRGSKARSPSRPGLPKGAKRDSTGPRRKLTARNW
jgi:hypothetical protein